MGNVRFYDLNLWDIQGLESSGALSSWPEPNTQERQKTQSVRLDGVSGQYVRTIGGSAIEIKAAFIIFHNFTDLATATLKGSDDDWLTTPFSQAFTVTEGKAACVLSAATTHDDWGIYIEDATNPDGYIEIGRVWIGDYYEPSGGFNNDYNELLVDPSINLTSTGGQKWPIIREQYKTWAMPFDCIYEPDRLELMFSRVGTFEAFIMQKQPEGHPLDTYPDPETNSHYVSLESFETGHLQGKYRTAKLDMKEEQ